MRKKTPYSVKFAVIGGSSCALIAIVYEALIRRVGILRFLFGMRPTTQNRTAGVQKTSASGAKA
jgi:hypothetical protein